jgi:hypothetical protein
MIYMRIAIVGCKISAVLYKSMMNFSQLLKKQKEAVEPFFTRYANRGIRRLGQRIYTDSPFLLKKTP